MLDSAHEILRRQASGEMTAVDVVRQSLKRIDLLQPVLNLFTHVAHESALKQAAAIDAKRTAGQPLGPLAGVPVAVKDVFCTKDMPTTCSSKMLQQFLPPYNANVVALLQQADAVIVGKTNMDEFAMGASTETSAFGITRNPWDMRRTPGGSSGGAAACVAAGCVPLSVGTDTGGSIRQPAAFCGITGMKPTYGRVSRYGLIAFASSLDQAGPMAWCAEDAAILLQVIAGYDSKDSTSLNRPTADYVAASEAKDMRGLRIGVIRDALESEGLEDSQRAAVNEAIAIYTSLGAQLIDVTLPNSKYAVPTYYVVAPCEASSNLSRYDGAHYGFRASNVPSDSPLGPLGATYCQSREQGFGAEVKRRIMLGTYALSTGYYDAYYLKALKVRRLIRQDYDAALAQVDLLLGPVTPTSAFELGAKLDDPIQMYLCDLFTVGANLAGVPAISIPGGFDSSGLPVGVQLQAPPLEESRLIHAAAAYQSVTEHHKARPTAKLGV